MRADHATTSTLIVSQKGGFGKYRGHKFLHCRDEIARSQVVKLRHVRRLAAVEECPGRQICLRKLASATIRPPNPAPQPARSLQMTNETWTLFASQYVRDSSSPGIERFPIDHDVERDLDDAEPS
jgi:hypothetical protein